MLDEIENGLKKHNWFTGFDISDQQPIKFTLNKWIKLAKQVQATVFIAGLNIFHLLINSFWIIHNI